MQAEAVCHWLLAGEQMVAWSLKALLKQSHCLQHEGRTINGHQHTRMLQIAQGR